MGVHNRQRVDEGCHELVHRTLPLRLPPHSPDEGLLVASITKNYGTFVAGHDRNQLVEDFRFLLFAIGPERVSNFDSVSAHDHTYKVNVSFLWVAFYVQV